VRDGSTMLTGAIAAIAAIEARQFIVRNQAYS
jgi:hypothetical protein